MPPIREHGVDHEDDDEERGVQETAEDDDMPGLVDQPMTYTFFTEMTPSSFDPASAPPSNSDASFAPFSFASAAAAAEQTESSILPPARTSHSKRRDASYIPRPPNAFILFRSSFIRSQQVTGKVEGNHSNLSKIIGMYWKTLPKAERDEWEAKAALAQLEHRKRYPDWRFRPGANALAKLKVKDGGSARAGPSRQRRIRGTKDPPDGDGDGERKASEEAEEDGLEAGGKGKGRARVRATSVRGRGKAREETDRGKGKGKEKEETRFAKIADLLVEGKKGVELEIAVQAWEGERKGKKRAKTDPDASTPTPSSDAATASPALSIAPPPVTHSPLSMWSATASMSSPATPDIDDHAPPPPRPTHIPTFSRRSRSRSPPRSTTGSPTETQQQEGTAEGNVPSLKRSSRPQPQTTACHIRRAGSRRPPRRVHHRSSASVSFSMDHSRSSPVPMGRRGRLDEGYRPNRSPLAQPAPASVHPHRGLQPGPGHARRDTISFPVSPPPPPHAHLARHTRTFTSSAYDPPPQAQAHAPPPPLGWRGSRRKTAGGWRSTADTRTGGSPRGTGTQTARPTTATGVGRRWGCTSLCERDRSSLAKGKGKGRLERGRWGMRSRGGRDGSSVSGAIPAAPARTGRCRRAWYTLVFTRPRSRPGSWEGGTRRGRALDRTGHRRHQRLRRPREQRHSHSFAPGLPALHADPLGTDVGAGGYFFSLPVYPSTFSSLAGWDGETMPGAGAGAEMRAAGPTLAGQERAGAAGYGEGGGRRLWYGGGSGGGGGGGGGWGGVQQVGLQGGTREWADEGKEAGCDDVKPPSPRVFLLCFARHFRTVGDTPTHAAPIPSNAVQLDVGRYLLSVMMDAITVTTAKTAQSD
ncbi:putative high mobility group [Lyophyllum shimeji]|uniref:High mobility group n=1 Tax=Lyophyllum shimeji TaxID=47721 RepID=A0A9P3PTH3_LYOSH|nr:putative high mobility group [Lyophyllum shimeji]